MRLILHDPELQFYFADITRVFLNNNKNNNENKNNFFFLNNLIKLTFLNSYITHLKKKNKLFYS